MVTQIHGCRLTGADFGISYDANGSTAAASPGQLPTLTTVWLGPMVCGTLRQAANVTSVGIQINIVYISI